MYFVLWNPYTLIIALSVPDFHIRGENCQYNITKRKGIYRKKLGRKKLKCWRRQERTVSIIVFPNKKSVSSELTPHTLESDWLGHVLYSNSDFSMTSVPSDLIPKVPEEQQ